MFTKAITRTPCSRFSQGLTTSSLGAPDHALMLRQHALYLETLERLGVKVENLPAEEAFPDAHFVEDTAVVTPEVAIITNPGAESRRGETATIAPVLARYRSIEQIETPGTVDGGDVLMAGDHFFIGLSERTNPEGAAQLGAILERYGKSWQTVEVAAGLHFKSSVNLVAEQTLLVSEDFAEHPALVDYERIVLDRDEEYAGNTLLVNGTLIMPAGFPKTREKLAALEMEIVELEMTETRKMDGGLTCLSLRF
ncbi:dimethylarginine dimethylaminohydrolase family protein [Desulfogranum mediterraneum]|uniref:dimethylarginine dimethylaminohydrolase family protein n=1 Tax=Desulfogranum mediterraneum TaxID=160661 RepID=UPI000406C0D4|nr:amidinotransferase [Desulfogranum mediterraneum]